MNFAELRGRFAERGRGPALVSTSCTIHYDDLATGLDLVPLRTPPLSRAGSVVALLIDHTPHSAAALLSLLARDQIVVPISRERGDTRTLIQETGANLLVDCAQGRVEVLASTAPEHPLYDQLRATQQAGLVLFTSGTSGRPKAALHAVNRFLTKYTGAGRPRRTLQLLALDHVAGLDALFSAVTCGGCVVFPASRRPSDVCAAIERFRVEVLPASPSFLNLLFIEGSFREHDLRSLEVITYGSEVMHDATLCGCEAAFPSARLLQRYGLTELGGIRSRSPEHGSAWLRLESEGVELRVVDGQLEIRSPSAMLGYLNAQSPFTADGWYRTGDLVEEKDGYVRILGRASQLINVSGQKVHPAEVENVIKQITGVEDVIVFGEPNPLVGQIVCATVKVAQRAESLSAAEIKRACRTQLDEYKVPIKVLITEHTLVTERLKRGRRATQISATS